MKIYLLIIVSLFLIISCSSNKSRKIASDENPVNNLTPIELDLQNLIKLAEESLVWRVKSVDFYHSVKDKIKSKRPMSHQEITTVFDNIKDYLQMREKIFAIVDKYKLNLGHGTSLKLKPNKETYVKVYPDDNPEDDIINGKQDRTVINLNPNDELGAEYSMKLKVGLMAAVLLYDNYMIGIYPYESSWKLRRLLNNDNVELNKKLEKFANSFFNLNSRIEFFTSIRAYKKITEYENKQQKKKFENESYVDEFIAESPIFHFMTTGKDLNNQPQILKTFADKIFDRVRFLSESFTYYASKVFGNVLGRYASRNGKLLNMPEAEKQELKLKFKPLDIFLEKTPFRLTDKFIPGHFGHVAIWIGTKEELIELGVWDDPLITKFHKEIESGHHIIEALRPGVQINTFDHFLDIDDFFVIRDEKLTLNDKKEFILRAFAQIGKAYDFNFDVETDKKIVCSEIVYVVFHDIKWPTEASLGRFTISPDNVAAKVLDGTLNYVLMYHDGERMNEDEIMPFLKQNLVSK